MITVLNYTPEKPRPTLAYRASQLLLAKPEVRDCRFCHEPGSHADGQACRRALDIALTTYRRNRRVGDRPSRARGRR